jgi:excisionase family DNA binding protein
MSSPLVWTIPEAAGLLGIGRSKMYVLAQRGELPVIRIGRRVLVPRAAFEEWVAEHTERSD